jgi:hypothetical protein
MGKLNNKSAAKNPVKKTAPKKASKKQELSNG